MDSSEKGRLSVVMLEITPGHEADLRAVTTALETVLARKNYGRADLIRDEAQPLRFYAVRYWNDASSAERCHVDPETQTLMQKLHELARVTYVINGVSRADRQGLRADRPGLLLDDRRARAESDRRAGFDRRIKDVGSPTGRDRRKGRDRRLGPRRVRNRPGEIEIVAAARRAREHADAAYSKFKVGAAIETADGTVVTGCNIENATYGLTICAERVAIFKALSEGHRAFTRIAIVADTEAPTPPCGACRQILWEFGGNLEVRLANLVEEKGTHRLKDLLPLPFDARLL